MPERPHPKRVQKLARRAVTSVADLKARTQQIFDLFNTHDVQAASAYFAEEAELRTVFTEAGLLKEKK